MEDEEISLPQVPSSIDVDVTSSNYMLTSSSSSKKKKEKKQKKEKKKRKHSKGDDGSSSLINGSSSSSKKKKMMKAEEEKKSPPAPEEQGGTSTAAASTTNSQELSPPSALQIKEIASQKLQQSTTAAAATTNGSIFSLIAASSSSSSSTLKKHTKSKSPYQIKTIIGTVALLPISLPNVPACIKNLLQSLLLMYDSNMGGVLLSLDDQDVQLLPIDYDYNVVGHDDKKKKGGQSSRNYNYSGGSPIGLIGGRIVNDLPYIHYKFKVRALLFCPQLNMKLNGTVVECTPTYITLTTHHILSTKISSETLGNAGYYYNSSTMEWVCERTSNSGARGGGEGGGGAGIKTAAEDDKDDDDDVLLLPSTSIYLNDTVEFIVERIHECGGYIMLDGKCPSVSTLG